MHVVGYHADASELAPKGWLTGSEWDWGDLYTDIVKTALAGDFTGQQVQRQLPGRLQDRRQPVRPVEVRPDRDATTRKALIAERRDEDLGRRARRSPARSTAQDGSDDRSPPARCPTTPRSRRRTRVRRGRRRRDPEELTSMRAGSAGTPGPTRSTRAIACHRSAPIPTRGPTTATDERRSTRSIALLVHRRAAGVRGASTADVDAIDRDVVALGERAARRPVRSSCSSRCGDAVPGGARRVPPCRRPTATPGELVDRRRRRRRSSSTPAASTASTPSPLDRELRGRGVDRLVLVRLRRRGRGRLHAAHRANDRGYECLTLTDAVRAARSRASATRALVSVTMSGGIFGAIGTTADLLAALGRADLDTLQESVR